MTDSAYFGSPFEHTLEQLPKERQQQTLLWFCQDSRFIEPSSKTLQRVLDNVYALDPTTCFEHLNTLDLESKVIYSILKEFGPSFQERSYFDAFVKAVVQRITNNLAGHPDRDNLDPPLASASLQ